MRVALFCFALFTFAAAMVLLIYVEPKAAIEGKGFSIPVWPFVMTLSFLMVLLAILFPHIPRLLEKWMTTRVEIAKAEHHVPAEEKKDVPPPPGQPEPSEPAKGEPS